MSAEAVSGIKSPSIERSDAEKAGRFLASTLTMVPPVDGPSLGKNETMEGSTRFATSRQ